MGLPDESGGKRRSHGRGWYYGRPRSPYWPRKEEMRHVAIALVLLGSWLGSLSLAAPARGATYTGPLGQQSVRQARLELRAAHRAAVRAAARESEARARLRAAVRYSEMYGAGVSRWVRLARRTGWPWQDFPTLMRVMSAESGGSYLARNAWSGAAGLMQLIPAHWQGQFDPYVPRLNLAYSLRLRRASGWSPWVTY